MVFHAARRRHALDAEHEGLVFGRLDLRDRQPCCTSAGWASATRTSAAAGGRLAGAGRRRLLPGHPGRAAGRGAPADDPVAAGSGSPASRTTCSTRRPRRRTWRWSATARCWPRLSKATGRGMRDIVATIQREQDEAIRSPASGVTIVAGGPGTGKTAVALHRAAYLLYSDRSRFAGGGILVVGPSGGVRRVHRHGAAVARRGHRDAALARLARVRATTPPAPTRPDVAAVKGSLRMRRVLERAVARRGAGRARPSCACSTGARCCGWTRAELDAIRRPGAAPGRPPQRGAPGRLRRGSSTRCGRRPAGCGIGRLPEQREFEAEIAERAGVPRVPARRGGRGCTPMRRAAAGWPTRTGCAAYADGHPLPARRSRLLAERVPDAWTPTG